MTDVPEENPSPDDDWNVELDAATADRAEELLRQFATEAELEMAVMVDRSGGMIAGVATRQDVDVSTVGALVAGAFGAMNALAGELGESRVRESLHQGSGDTVYLREVGGRFILLGVAPSSLPSGIIREKGAQVAGQLGGILEGDASASDGPIPPATGPAEAPPERPVSGDADADAATGEIVHTEISVEDDQAVSMPSIDPAVREPNAGPEPEPEAPGEKPNYIFEIG